jgi:hypothetical protein
LDLLLLWIIVVVALQLTHYDFETLIALTACTHSLAKHSRHQVSLSGPLQAGLMHAGPFKLELVILVLSNLLPDNPDSLRHCLYGYITGLAATMSTTYFLFACRTLTVFFFLSFGVSHHVT